LRGLHIALNVTIKHTPKGYIVPSESGSGNYIVSLDLSECTCPDYEQRQTPCKHIHVVRHQLEGLQEVDEEDYASLEVVQERIKA
jgi:uncharacterized Zn finger protein